MLHVDNRAGSDQLIPLLRRCGLPVQPSRMTYGDIKFLGYGIEGCPVTIGVECKGIHDILHCVTDGRFAGHQLPGMVTSYDQPWLLIAGQWRAQRDTGLLQYLSRSYQWRDAMIGSRRFMWRDLAGWMLTMRTKTGILVDTVPDWDHAALWLSSLYSWWTQTTRISGEEVTGWETHKSHLAMNGASNEQFWARVKQEERDAGRNGGRLVTGAGGAVRRRLADTANLLRPTVCRMAVSQLPGVGYTRSDAVAKRFATLAEVCAATEKELMEVEGIGKLGARKLWQAIHRG
jgi:hypothetical protein